MRRLICLLAVVAVALLAAIIVPKTYHAPSVRATPHEVESDPPPPPELKEARFGGEPMKAGRRPMAPQSTTTVAAANWRELGPLIFTPAPRTAGCG